MGEAISISQNEIDALLGFGGGPSLSIDTPHTTTAPPSMDTKPSKPAQKAEHHALNNITDSKKDTLKQEISLIRDIPLELTVELGRAKRSIADILDFGLGTVIELNRLAGEPVDLLANGKLIAKGEVVIIDENFAVRITEIISTPKKAS